MNQSKVSYLLFLLCVSCAQVTSLNLQKHQFGQVPTKIIWIQVAGFEEEHLATLKFDSQKTDSKSSFENFLCIGKAWEYNLFDIRPTAYSSFHGQLTGKVNIKNSCVDYRQKPVWSYIAAKGYKVGAFEGEMDEENSFLKAEKCSESKEYLQNLSIWKMAKAPKGNKNFYHVNEKSDFEKDLTYYDRSCLTGECYSTLSQNIQSVFTQFSRKSKNYMFIVRDFNYKENLNKNNYKKYKNSLIELEKTVDYFINLSNKNKDMLVLLTSASSRSIVYPRSGKQWQAFEKKGSFLKQDKSKLINTVFASGARAENFCGVYNQSEIVKRMFSGAKQQGLELAIINPFE
jgi:hypothetical protein